jgi:RsiW-degrading membrane proteinase PrsW (M82 family)
MQLLSLALAPMFIAAFYIYIRDKYEKEPVRLLITGLIYGAFIIVPVVRTQYLLLLFTPNSGVAAEAFFCSFIVAALTEEFYKYIVLFFLVWRNRNFNERFDGIVYAVFISLGFAGVENLLYVLSPELGGVSTALSRAVFAVPGHALFGVAMGYYFAMARFEPSRRKIYFALAFFVPFLLHGTYNFILLSDMQYLMAVFCVFVGYMWVSGFRKMKEHIEASPFKGV